MTAYPEQLTFQHLVYTPETGVDTHGNVVGSYSDPVDCTAIGWYQTGTSEPISVDYVARTITEMTILVADPNLFSAKDMVMVNGLAYEIAGVPADWSGGMPWRQFAGFAGGEIRVRRVD